MNDFVVTINGNKKYVSLSKNSTINIDGKIVEVNLTEVNQNVFLFKVGKKYYHLSAEKKNSETLSLSLNGNIYEVTVRTTLQEKANDIEKISDKKSHFTVVKAPMPGKIIKICKKIGDEVFLGDSLIILEAMKMENNIHSPSTGIIKNILTEEGSTVEKGNLLLEIK